MFDLQTIVKMNSTPVKIEDNHNRHCSFSGSVSEGIVLHSAKRRDTVFLSAGARSASFVQGFCRCDSIQADVDALIESFFQ